MQTKIIANTKERVIQFDCGPITIDSQAWQAAKIFNRVFNIGEKFGYSMPYIKNVIENSSYKYVASLPNGKVVGCALWEANRLDWLFVNPKYQGYGVAQHLVSIFATHAHKFGELKASGIICRTPGLAEHILTKFNIHWAGDKDDFNVIKYKNKLHREKVADLFCGMFKDEVRDIAYHNIDMADEIRLAASSNNIVGAIFWHKNKITWVFVHKGYREHHVAKKLLDAFCLWCDEYGYEERLSTYLISKGKEYDQIRHLLEERCIRWEGKSMDDKIYKAPQPMGYENGILTQDEIDQLLNGKDPWQP